MTDFFLQMGVSNACLSLALAIVAMAVGAKARRPHLAHLLWLLVFIKLLTPPIVTIPVVTFPMQTDVLINDNSITAAQITNSDTHASSLATIWSVMLDRGKAWLPPIWLLGSVVVFAFSMVRVCRFSRLLVAKSEAAPQELQAVAAKMARRLGMKRIPAICTTSARISPMVWWIGGKVRIVIPTTLFHQMDAQQSQWILAHEMAHVRRRDYLVRWVEWLACVCFWWNPVVWWAQRNLRAAEEICCDELVISKLHPKPKSYANSLLSAVEFLARPALRPPAMASEINSGGFLERRFKMIVSNKSKQSNCRWLQICVLLFAVVVLPFGIASAQDYKAVEKRLAKAVKRGELTLKQASVMMDALRKAGGVKKDQDLDNAKAYLMKVKKELGAAVEAGRISKEDAAKRYKGAEKAIKERAAAGRKQPDSKRITREDYVRAEADLKKLVAEGKISKEDLRTRLNEMRKMMAELGERGERLMTVEEYKRAEAKMRKMIEDGKAKPEDVERRLIEMRKMIGRQRERGARGERERGERRMTVEEYRSAEAKMRRMIEEGKAKPEDVERRLIEMRKMIGERGEGERTARGGAQGDYAGFERRIKAAVAQGKMTREEAGEKLASFRRRMAMAEEGERGEKRITREDYARAEAEMKKMVEAGKISKEDMRARLNEMRRMMGDEISDDATGRRR